MRIQKHIWIMAVLVIFTSQLYAQATASTTASVTIVRPIDIARTADLNFGNVAAPSSGLGAATINPLGNRSSTGGVHFPTTTGTTTAAMFTVTGEDGYTFTITLPATDVTLSNGNKEMVVNTFTSSPSVTGTLEGGTATIKVGATLHIQAQQEPGVYVSTNPISITVNYN